MSEELFIIGGIILILLVIRMLRKRKKNEVRQDTAAVAVKAVPVAKAPPPLPVRRAPALPPRYPNLRALDYPKCPIDRGRNEPGKRQVIFWDSANNCYICCHGHHFTGRE